MLLLPLMLHHDSEPRAGERDNGPKERGGAERRAALQGLPAPPEQPHFTPLWGECRRHL